MTQTANLKDKLATTNGNGSTAVAKKMDRADTVARFLKDQWPAIKNIIPSHATPERLVRIALTEIRGNPKLMACTVESLVGAILQGVKFGLEPGDGLCFLIPYGNEASFQLGYRGVAQLMYQSGRIAGVNWAEVCENDEYCVDYGPDTTPYVRKARGARGAVIGYFAYVRLDNGGYLWAYMTKTEVEEHAKKFSKNGWDRAKKEFRGTWKDHFDSMAKKTVLLQVAKLAPRSTEMQEAFKADNTIVRGIDGDVIAIPADAEETPAEVIDESTGEVIEAQAQATDELDFPEGLK